MSKLNLKFGKKKNLQKYDGVQNKEITILNEKSKFAISEAYKSLRTNILFSNSSEGSKCFVLTSAIPGEGKTTTAINLAISFAQTEKKVVLIDADLRKPKLHKYFDTDNKVGLSNVLAGMVGEKNKDYIKKTNIENLDIIGSGHIPPNPMELLSSDNVGKFVEGLKTEYDYVIFDTPPVNIVSDALVLSKCSTGYILVTRSGYTEYSALNTALSNLELANIKPLGVVLNDFNHKQQKYVSNGKYRYKSYYNYYRYGN